MTKSRPQKNKQTYFRKNYAPARAAALRSKKTSTRLRAKVSQQIENVSKKVSKEISSKTRSRKTSRRTTAKVYSARSKTQRNSRHSNRLGFLTWREITLLSSIGVCALMIVFTFIYTSIADPVKRSEQELAKIADAYYIEYYYPRILGKYLYQPEEVLADYAAAGLPTVRLRQLLLSNDGKYSSSADAFSNQYYQCDTNSTFVRYYPVAPYGPRDYTVTYNTACEKVSQS